MISPRKFRQLAAQSAAEADHVQNATTKNELLKKARLGLKAARELERLGFRDKSVPADRRGTAPKPQRKAIR